MALRRAGVCRGNALVYGRETRRTSTERAPCGRRGFSTERVAGDEQNAIKRLGRVFVVAGEPSHGTVLARKAREEGQEGSERMYRASSWVVPMLGMSALGCGALMVNQTIESPARTEGRLGQEDKNNSKKEGQKGVSIQSKEAKQSGLREETPVGVERALQKRRSCGRERLMISTAAVRGDRAHMEDTHYVSSCKRFSAVFDGHGGAAVAQYLQQNLYSTLAPTLAQLDQVEPEEGNHTTSRSALEDMLRQAVDRVDADVIARSEWKYQGSTAVGVLLHGDAIFSFNVGDSRAVMSRGGQVVELTRDHKPNDPIELTRIQKLGGSVKWHGYVDAQGEPIEPYGAYRINGNLAVARAIGDRDLRPYVSGEVEIKQFDRDLTKDEFIVIASDGLWDVFTSDEAVTFVHDVLNGEVGGRESWRSGAHGETRVSIFEWSHQYKSDRGMIKAARLRRKTQIANYLVQEALFRGTSDNVSVVVVWLK